MSPEASGGYSLAGLGSWVSVIFGRPAPATRDHAGMLPDAWGDLDQAGSGQTLGYAATTDRFAVVAVRADGEHPIIGE